MHMRRLYSFSGTGPLKAAPTLPEPDGAPDSPSLAWARAPNNLWLEWARKEPETAREWGLFVFFTPGELEGSTREYQ